MVYKILELLLNSDSNNESQNNLSKYFIFLILEVSFFLERRAAPPKSCLQRQRG